MSIAGLGGLSSLGDQYNFTSMTNAQLLSAAHSLGAEGKISSLDEAQLVATASGADSTPISGEPESVANVLQDPTKRNFVGDYQMQLASAQLCGSPQTAALDQGILSDLYQYQNQTNDAVESASTISTQA
jgi:hypothetical protein